MRTFRMSDVEQIEKMMADGKTVEVEWFDLEAIRIGRVKSVRWDGLVFTTDGAVFTGLDNLIEIREVA